MSSKPPFSSIRVVYEGATDWPILEKLMREAGWDNCLPEPQNGKSQVDEKLSKFVEVGRANPIAVFRDLDQDALCAPGWFACKKVERSRWGVVRLAVRSIEAWFLADRENAALALDVSIAKIPRVPDDERDAKRKIVSLAASSKNRRLKEELVPAKGFSSIVGAGYSNWFKESCSEWNIDRARKVSDSLDRAFFACKRLHSEYWSFVNGKL